MTNGIRVNDSCDLFFENDISVPKLLKEQVDTMCAVASQGNPDFLEPDEVALLDASSELYPDYTGVEEFARTIKNVSNWPINNTARQDYQRFYRGFAATAVSEPPFKTGDVLVDKVAEDPKSGAQTVTINGEQFQFILYPNHIMATVKATIIFTPDGSAIEQGNYGSLSFPDFNLTPFSHGYEGDIRKSGERALQDEGSFSFNENIHLIGFPQTPFAWGLSQETGEALYVDSDGRFLEFQDEESIYKVTMNGLFPAINIIESAKIVYKVILSYSDGETGFMPNKEYHTLTGEFKNYEWPNSGGGLCFSGNMLLQTDDGSPVNFKELYRRYDAGEEMPFLKVWDPDKNEWTPQQPLSVQRHLVEGDFNFVNICYEDADHSQCGLEVTPNHMLWVKQNGVEVWTAAENLKTGDMAKVGDGWVKIVRENKDAPSRFVKNDRPNYVYNLSFGHIKGLYSNYAVSDTGETWFIAHNKAF